MQDGRAVGGEAREEPGVEAPVVELGRRDLEVSRMACRLSTKIPVVRSAAAFSPRRGSVETKAASSSCRVARTSFECSSIATVEEVRS